MQIRLTVLGPRSGHCDVLVTAPAGTPLSAVAGAISASAGAGQASRSAAAVLYAGTERLAASAVLGHPPLVDGAVVSLNTPAEDQVAAVLGQVPRLQVVGGPDAGGVHLLHGGPVRVGRSADADVPLDDPDVSRLHIAVTVDGGAVTVADLGSTNGTALDDAGVGPRPVPFLPGALLRLGESTLTLALPSSDAEEPANRPAVPDGEGHLQVSAAAESAAAPPVPAAAQFPSPGQGARAMSAKSLAKRLTGARAAQSREHDRRAEEARSLRVRWPDPSEILLTALGPGPRLWERGAGHADALTVRLGTQDEPGQMPVVADLREVGVLGLAGPGAKVHALARSIVAQLSVLHGPSALELVLLCGSEEQAESWSWLRWLPQLRPAQGQDCRLLLGIDADQQERRVAELLGRLETPGSRRATVVVVDESAGRPVQADLTRLLERGPAAGVFALHVAADPDRLVASCGARAVLTGEVSAYLDVDLPEGRVPGNVVADAVSAAWAERLCRALAPLREAEGPRPRSALPETARLLDALDLALATPAKISARWSELPATGGATSVVLGTAAEGRCAIDLALDGPHLLVGGAPASGKSELLRSVVASLCAADRPDRLSLLLIDGAGDGREGLRGCTDLPHVSTYLEVVDPVRTRELAQAITAELNRREELLGGRDFGAWQAERLLASSQAAARAAAGQSAAGDGGRGGSAPARAAERGAVRTQVRTEPLLPRLVVVADDFDALVAPALGSPGRQSAGSMVRALDAVARRGARLGVHLVAATGRPERTSGGEVDEQARLRVALRTDDPVSSRLLVHVEDAAALDEALPGRGYLRRADGSVTPFQAARVSGRIPRTATLRPTVVPLDWARMGDPPTRRPVRELGNGPTDLALLASALQRAAESTEAHPAPSLG